MAEPSKPMPFGERALELGGRDGHRLQEAQDVGEPHPDEPDIPFLDGPQHELGLLVHRPVCRPGCNSRVTGQAGKLFGLLAHRRSQSIVGVLSRYAHPLVAS